MMLTSSQAVIAATLVLSLTGITYGCINELQECTQSMLRKVQAAAADEDKEGICSAAYDGLRCLEGLTCQGDVQKALDQGIAQARQQLKDTECNAAGLPASSVVSLLLMLIVGFFLKQ